MENDTKMLKIRGIQDPVELPREFFNKIVRGSVYSLFNSILGHGSNFENPSNSLYSDASLFLSQGNIDFAKRLPEEILLSATEISCYSLPTIVTGLIELVKHPRFSGFYDAFEIFKKGIDLLGLQFTRELIVQKNRLACLADAEKIIAAAEVKIAIDNTKNKINTTLQNKQNII